MNIDKEAVTATDKPVDLVLTGESDGLKIRQTLRFHPGGYAVDALPRVENVSGASRTIGLSLPWFTRQAWHTVPEKFPGQHPAAILWEAARAVHRIGDFAASTSRIV